MNKDILNPAGVFLFIWNICCSLANLYLSNLQVEWSATMHAAVCLSSLSFCFGALLMYPKRRFQVLSPEPTTNTFRILTRAVFVLAFLSFLTEWKINGFHLTILSLGDSGDLKSSTKGVPFLHYGTLLVPLSGVLAIYEMLNDGKKVYLYFVMFSAFFLYSVGFGLSRGDMFMYLGAILYLVSRYKRISVKALFRFALIGIGVAVGFMLMRVSGDDSVVYTSTNNKFVSIFYSYIALNFENLRQLVDSNIGPHLMGNATFRPIWTILGMKDSFPIIEYDTIGVFNAKTYLYSYYHDYLLPGVVVFPFLIGFVLTSIYKLSAISRNHYYFVVMAVLQKPIYVNFFGDYFFGEMVILWPYLIAFLLAYVSKYKILFKEPQSNPLSLNK